MENINFIEIIKDIAAVLGCIVTLSGVLSIFSKTIRSFWGKIFKVYGNEKEIEEFKNSVNENIKSLKNKELQDINKAIEKLAASISELSKKQDDHLKTYEEKMQNVEDLMDIDTEFVRTQCRTIVKNMFYKYCKEERLPLYEYKTLLKVEELYVNRCHGNSFAQGLISRMKTWEIDYTNSLELEDDN